MGGIKKITWITDPHYDFLKPVVFREHVKLLFDSEPDILLFSGDISTSDKNIEYLEYIACKLVKTKIGFVLGNHDFYKSSIKEVKENMKCSVDRFENLHWFDKDGALEVDKDTAIVGAGSWADCRFGNWKLSNVELNDYYYIKELKKLNKDKRKEVMQSLAQEAAETVLAQINSVIDKYKTFYVVTHVPPFASAAWYEGKMSDSNYLPHFSCKIMGDVLLCLMEKHIGKKMVVLCGHTHGNGEVQILENLKVITGGATYNVAQITKSFMIGEKGEVKCQKQHLGLKKMIQNLNW